MRLFLGIILGFILTVGGAYLADTMNSNLARPMVNWDVVGQNFDVVTDNVRKGWARLSSLVER